MYPKLSTDAPVTPLKRATVLMPSAFPIVPASPQRVVTVPSVAGVRSTRRTTVASATTSWAFSESKAIELGAAKPALLPTPSMAVVSVARPTNGATVPVGVSVQIRFPAVSPTYATPTESTPIVHASGKAYAYVDTVQTRSNGSDVNPCVGHDEERQVHGRGGVEPPRQKKPMSHTVPLAVIEPAAHPKPSCAVHGVHCASPPAENVPPGHGTGTEEGLVQKNPAGHSV